jgi:hypothetical protein
MAHLETTRTRTRRITGNARHTSHHARPWDIVIKIAVEADGATEARSIVDLMVGAMNIAIAGTPPSVQFDDGTWVTEVQVAEPTFEHAEPNGAMSVLSTLTANLGPVTWRGISDTPFDPDSARAAQIEWPPGFWALAGRKETLVHPSVRAMLLQARSAASPKTSAESPRPF